MQLIEYIKALENKDNRARGEQVLTTLQALGIEPIIQQNRWPRIRNIIVDFSPDARNRNYSLPPTMILSKGNPAPMIMPPV